MTLALALLAFAGWAFRADAAVNATATGEIQRITITNPGDPWSGGTIDIGGTIVVVPRNLLIDLPANRLTLQQLVAEAPPSCAALGETGLAKGDFCNTSGTAGIATATGNRTNAGDFVAGDLFIQKGIEAITGVVTFINYTDGYFCLNGPPGADCVTGAAPAITQTGTMVRLNDPGTRHTIQQGLGCATGNAVNCSADPRFTLDPDNYTNVFATGYPICLPSTVARPFPGLPAVGGPAVAAGTAAAAAGGTGDLLCPRTNRNPQPLGVTEPPVADSRRFAPIVVGDNITVEGNFETVGGVRFLSAHSSMASAALVTNPGTPDYFFLDEVEIDVAGYQNQRVRSLIIGFATVAPPDIVIWGVHYDPATNAPHELPLASTLGCDIAGGAGTCGGQGLVAAGANIFKIRHDVDFLLVPPADRPRLSPCAHLRADPRFAALNICPSADAQGLSTLAEEFAILAPMPREIQARSGNSLAFPGLPTLDVNGNPATNGQYLFPFGVGLGGVAFPEMVEINLAGLATPNIFEGLPWTLDRRLSPGGCIGTCEATPQPLDPYPFSGLDPRIQALLPQGPYNDPNFTATPLARASNRILSYVDAALGRFNGDATVLAYPPIDPPAQVLPAPPPPVSLVCAAAPPAIPNQPPVAVSDAASTTAGVAVTIPVLANDTDPDLNLLTIVSVSAAINGVVANNGVNVTYTPNASFAGADAFTYTVSDGQGGFATAVVSVQVSSPIILAPTAFAGGDQSVLSGALVTLNGSGIDTNVPALAITYAWTQVSGPAVALSNPAVAAPTFTAPTVLAGELPVLLAFSLTVTNTAGVSSAPAVVTITVNGPPVNPLAPIANAGLPQTVASNALVTLDGTGSTDPNVPPLALNYAWLQLAGAPVTLNLADIHRPSFTAPVVLAPEVLTFQLTVTNTAGLSSSATVVVTVNAVVAPTAIAAHGGAGQAVLAGTTVTLHGEDSTDPQGLPLTYAWTQVSGAVVTIVDPTLAHAAFTAPAMLPGQPPLVLAFQLVVNNGFLSSAPAQVSITVNPPGDIVAITRVEYRLGAQRLRVDASTTSPTALLTLQPWAPGTVATPMTALGGGNFTADLPGVPRPTNDTVTVTSSLGGTATSPITRLRN